MQERNRLYSLLIMACFAGYIWIYYGTTSHAINPSSTGVCLVKNLTHIPCPSCGSTRSVISLLNGRFIEAMELNPIGYLIVVFITVIPFWVAIDLFRNTGTLHRFYKKSEMLLQKPAIYVPLILLVIINWIWNIVKEV